MNLLTMPKNLIIAAVAVLLSLGGVCLADEEASSTTNVLADRLFGRWVADEELTKRLGYTKEDEIAEIAFQKDEAVREGDVPEKIAAFMKNEPCYAAGSFALLPGSKEPRKYSFLLMPHHGRLVVAWWDPRTNATVEAEDWRIYVSLIQASKREQDLLFLKAGHGHGRETLVYRRYSPPPEALPWKKRRMGSISEIGLAKRLGKEGLLPKGVKAEAVYTYPELARLFVENDAVRRWIMALVKDDEATWEWRGAALGVVTTVGDEHKDLLLDSLQDLVSWARNTKGKTRSSIMVRRKTEAIVTYRALRVEDPGRRCLEIVKTWVDGAWKEWLTRIAQRGVPEWEETDRQKANRQAEQAGAKTLLRKFAPEEAP